MQRVPKMVEIAYRPPIGLADCDVVQLGPGDYWRLRGIHTEKRGRAWRMFADLEPMEPGEMLNGFGELTQDPVALEVIEP